MPRIAKSLDTLRSQVNAMAPDRSKVSDGWLGDSKHQARKSDHNVNKKGVVQAFDITHDPKGGFNSYAFAELLRVRRDPRIKYVISNGRIFAGLTGPKPWEWRKYTGSNKHSQHVHISVEDIASLYDDPKKWDVEAASPPDIEPVEDKPKKSGITEGAVAGGGLSIAAVGGQVWDGVKEAPEGLLSASLSALQKPAVFLSLLVVGMCIYIYFMRRKQKANQ